MYKKLLALIATTVISSVTWAQAHYVSTIDLSHASNNALVPTIINAGKYSVEITIQDNLESAINNISLQQSLFSDNQQSVCVTEGSFKVGTAVVKIKSLENRWQQIVTTDINANFSAEEDSDICNTQAKNFLGVQKFKISPTGLNIKLPVNDPRFAEVKLAIQPMIDGYLTEYELLAGDVKNTLKVINPGLSFKIALQENTMKVLAHTLSLTANGYYHYDTQYTPLIRK